jgi:L-threonate 2-dehydrogenase
LNLAKPRVGVIGVGAMGLGVAKALLAKGFEVFVRDLVDSREAAARSAGAQPCSSAAELAARSQVVVTLVVDAAQTRAVLFGLDGAAPAMKAGSVIVMSSTIAPGDAQSIAAELASQGVPMVDAPVSGGPARARAGTLSTMASGSDEAFALCEPVLAATSAKCFRVGTRAGDGSRMKVVNNMLAAANLAAGCEALVLAAKLGLDLKQVRDIVNASSGQSWIFADRMARALEGDHAPNAAARVLTKDIGLFVELARSLGIDPPMARCAQAIFEDTVQRGLGEEDDAAVLKRYAAAWGVVIPA